MTKWLSIGMKMALELNRYWASQSRPRSLIHQLWTVCDNLWLSELCLFGGNRNEMPNANDASSRLPFVGQILPGKANGYWFFCQINAIHWQSTPHRTTFVRPFEFQLWDQWLLFAIYWIFTGQRQQNMNGFKDYYCRERAVEILPQIAGADQVTNDPQNSQPINSIFICFAYCAHCREVWILSKRQQLRLDEDVVLYDQQPHSARWTLVDDCHGDRTVSPNKLQRKTFNHTST